MSAELSSEKREVNRMTLIKLEDWEDWLVPALQIALFPIWIVGGLIQLSYWKIRNSTNPKGSYYNVDGTLVIPSKIR